MWIKQQGAFVKFSCFRKSVFSSSNFRAPGFSPNMAAEASDDQIVVAVIEDVMKNNVIKLLSNKLTNIARSWLLF